MLYHHLLLRRLRVLAPHGGPPSGWLSTHAGQFRSLSFFPDKQEAAGSVDRVEERDKSYVDRLKITAAGGRGGNGCVSFWRSVGRGKNAPADGGNGGAGGNVVLRACSNMKSLAGVQQLYKAEPGGHGSKQKQHGRAGRDMVVLVPVGTVVSRLDFVGEEAEASLDPRPSPGATAVQGGQQRSSSSSSSSSSGGGGGAGASGGQLLHHHLPRRKRSQQGAAGVGDGEEEEELRPAREEEIPDWLKRWRQPWMGARDYRSEEEEEPLSGEDEEEGEGAGAGGRGSGQAWRGEGYPVLADLAEDGQEVVVARGGEGGRGNAAYRSRPNRPAPATGERGFAGERSRLLLELKLLADVGLVGLPNAGKSTLLRAISNATPRVGSYAFTTLAPQLGVVELPDSSRVVVADIPGLIEGASDNRGLGHHFLRHIERTKALAYVVDASAGLNGAPGVKPWDALDLLQHEILEYSQRLDALPALVVANKVDLLPSPASMILTLQRRTDLRVVAVSGREHVGIAALLEALQGVVGEGQR